jgi:hypothetical protein
MDAVFIAGWLASLLIVGAYVLNLRGIWKTNSKVYIWANFVGGILFIYNTYCIGAYPSMAVNVVWVAVALWSIAENFLKKKETV